MSEENKNSMREHEWQIQMEEKRRLRDDLRGEYNILSKELARLKKAGLDTSLIIAKRIEIKKETEKVEKEMENLLNRRAGRGHPARDG